MTEPRRIRELLGAIRTIRLELERAEKYGMKHYVRVYNVALYFLVFEYDVAVLKQDALFSMSKWRKSFIARQLAAVLYEAADDLCHLLGKEFRRSLSEIGVVESEMLDFNSITSALNTFRKKNNPLLREVRNVAGAHRDQNAVLLLRTIEDVDLLQVMELAGDFYESVGSLNWFLIDVIRRMGNINIMIRHIDVQRLFINTK